MARRAHAASRALAGVVGLACVAGTMHATAGNVRAAIAVSATVAPTCVFTTSMTGPLDVRCSSGARGDVTLASLPVDASLASDWVPVRAHARSADVAHGSCAFVLTGQGLASAVTTAATACTHVVSAPQARVPHAGPVIEAHVSF